MVACADDVLDGNFLIRDMRLQSRVLLLTVSVHWMTLNVSVPKRIKY